MPGRRFVPASQSPKQLCASGAPGCRLPAAFLVRRRPLPEGLAAPIPDCGTNGQMDGLRIARQRTTTVVSRFGIVSYLAIYRFQSLL
jgi:hypothetical protein